MAKKPKTKKLKARKRIRLKPQPKFQEYSLAKLKVVGIGGAGGNAISRMYNSSPRGIDLIAVNTDLQDLNHTHAKKKIQIGKNLTRGLGTGMNPDLGRQAAEESRAEVAEFLGGADMVFLTGGFGGGTCTGAAPIVAEIARELGILTVAIITKPFGFEGAKRIQIAEEGVGRIRNLVDTLIIIPNDRVFSLIDKNTSLTRAFEEIDEILKNAVFGIAELITVPGIINIDFADVKTIIQDGGTAIIGIGVASGPDRSIAAANAALNSPLLEVSIEGAKGVLFNIAGHRDLKMSEVHEIAKLIAESADPSAKIIFGTHYDRKLKKGQVKVSLVATGYNHGLGKGNMLFPGFFSSGAPRSAGEAVKEGAEVPNSGEVPLARQNNYDNTKATSLFGKQVEVKNESKPKEKGDIWDIPTFLRRKKRKIH